MRKVLVFLLIATLLLGISVNADSNVIKSHDLSKYDLVKSDKVLFQLVSELYIDGNLESSESIDFNGDYYTKKISSKQLSAKDLKEKGFISDIKNAKSEVIPTFAIYEETFDCTSDAIISQKSIKCLLTTGAGVSKTTYFCDWTETWLVDEFGNKLSLESSTSPQIYAAENSYWCLPTFTMTRDSWTVSPTIATATGSVESIDFGGTVSYVHSVLPSKD